MRSLRVATAVTALALTLVGCVAREAASDQPGDDGFTPAPTEEVTTTEGECGFRADDSGEDPIVGLPPDEGPVEATSLTLTTSAGPIAIQLDAERAPCTVQSQVFLAGEQYFDNTVCHRLTASDGLKVLQCGDPLGTGGGGPGYTIPDELPTDLEAGPTLQDGTPTAIYPRGTVAMANSGPESGGSQFFLVYGDSTLPPNYTVFGTVDEAGLGVLDQIAAAGITPGENGPQDGAPTTEVKITSAVAE